MKMASTVRDTVTTNLRRVAVAAFCLGAALGCPGTPLREPQGQADAGTRVSSDGPPVPFVPFGPQSLDAGAAGTTGAAGMAGATGAAGTAGTPSPTGTAPVMTVAQCATVPGGPEAVGACVLNLPPPPDVAGILITRPVTSAFPGCAP
jgi:hypothetical protein